MKKIVLFLLTVFMPIVAFSQNQHMTFMGIPLTGTINAFQSKLATKGVVPNTRANSQIAVGVRAFNGDFAGFEARIYVYYDKNTKIVYRAKAVISDTDMNIFEQKYNQIESLVQSKYDGELDTDKQNGHDAFSITTDLGVVSVYTSMFTESYPTEYNVHVDYEDFLNGYKHRKSQLDDI